MGNPLDRSCLTGDRKDSGLMTSILSQEGTRCMICSNQDEKNTTKVILCENSSTFSYLTYLSVQEAVQVTGSMSTSDLILFGEVVALGVNEVGCWVLSLDISAIFSSNDQFLNNLRELPDRNGASYVFYSGRSLYMKSSSLGFSKQEVALAGQALAMARWHSANRFTGGGGLPTFPVECGMKRSGGTSSREKLYPRIDPVAICLVISPDGESILLGRMKRSPPGMFSCLSGFVDQCESVQEAVCREVLEESGIRLDLKSVRLVDSQPWPIGRGGGCELMLGCIAQASSNDIRIYDNDVAEVRWFDRKEIRDLVMNQIPSGSPQNGANDDSKKLEGVVKATIPGENAIAHHLIKSFLYNNIDMQHGSKDSRDCKLIEANTSTTNSAFSSTISRFSRLAFVPFLMFLLNSRVSISIKFCYNE